MEFKEGSCLNACVICGMPPTDGYIDVNVPGVNLMDVICSRCAEAIAGCYAEWLERRCDSHGDDAGADDGQVFVCSVCGKAFADQRRLNSHKAVHTKEAFRLRAVATDREGAVGRDVF